MSKNKSLFKKALFKLNSASKAIKQRINHELQIFKASYSKLVADKSLSKKAIMSQMQEHFKKQNLKLGRSKFFDFQKRIQEEELKKDWWVTKRKKEIEERNQKLRELGAKEIQMIVYNSNGEDIDQFLQTKDNVIKSGVAKGSKKGGETTKGKFI